MRKMILSSVLHNIHAEFLHNIHAEFKKFSSILKPTYSQVVVTEL